MNRDEIDHNFKLLFVGSERTGKSSLVTRFADNTFTATYISTIGVDFKVSTVQSKGKRIKLQLWDTSGQERFHGITSNYNRNSHGFFLVFDLTDLESFYNLKTFAAEIEKNGPEKKSVMVVGNKHDIASPTPVVSPEQIQAFCGTRWPYIEVSAKSGHNVQAMFSKMVELILDPEVHCAVTLPPPLKIAVFENTQETTGESAEKIEDETMNGRLLDQRDFDLNVYAQHIDLPKDFVPKLVAKATNNIRQGFRMYNGNGIPKSFDDLRLTKEDYPPIGLTCCVHDPLDPNICELFTNNEFGLLCKNFIVLECLLKPAYLESTYFYSDSLLVGPAGLTTSLWDLVNSYLPPSQIEDLYVRFYSYDEGQSLGKSVQCAACELRGLKLKLTSGKRVRFTQEADSLTLVVSSTTFRVSREGQNVEVRFSQYPTVCIVPLPSLRLVMCVEQGELAKKKAIFDPL